MIVTLLSFTSLQANAQNYDFDSEVAKIETVIIDMIREGKVENIEALVDMADPRIFAALSELKNSYSKEAEDKLKYLLFNQVGLDSNDFNFDEKSLEKIGNQIKNHPQYTKFKTEIENKVREFERATN